MLFNFTQDTEAKNTILQKQNPRKIDFTSKNPKMSLSDLNIKYVLTSFDAGISPLRILNALLSAGVTELEPITILQCLREKGRLSYDDPLSSASQDDLLRGCEPFYIQQPNHAPGSSTATQERQGFDTPTSPTSATALDDPGPTMLWDTLADTFTLAAHGYGQSVPKICALLRSHGFDVTQEQVLTSLIRQGAITEC